MTPSTTTAAPNYVPDIREIVLTLWRRRMLIALVMVLTVVPGMVYILSQPDSYTATATIMLDDPKVTINDFEDVTAGEKVDNMSVQTAVSILKSPALALQSVKATGIDKNPEFAAANGDIQVVVRRFISHLSISSKGTSRTLDISFTARDPKVAADAVNAQVKSYLDSQVAMKQARVEQLSKWFEGKVNDLKADVTAKSQAVDEFRASENLIIGKDEQALVYQQISDISAQLAPIQTRKYEAQSKLDALGQAGKKGSASIDAIVSSPLIQNLKVQASTAAQEVESLRGKYGDNHPKMVEARNRLTQVNRAIATESANIKTALKNNADSATVQEAMLEERLGILQQQANELRAKMITLNSLQAEKDASQKLLDSFLSTYGTIQSQGSFARPDAVVVSAAAAPVSAAGPGTVTMGMALMVFAGCLALAAVFMVELMRGGVRDYADVRKLGQKPLGIMPQVADPMAAILNDAGSGFKESVKRIYMSALMNNPAQAVLVTSALPGEGRTTFATAMAQYLASLGHSVALIDADFLQPTLSRSVSVQDGPGLMDVLAGRATLEGVTVRDKNGLSVIRAGIGALDSPDVLRSEKFAALLAQVKQRYQYVLIDSGPLLAHAEAEVIAGQVDGIIVVASWMKTSQQNIGNVLATLKHVSAPVLGIVINRVDIGKYKTISSGSDFLLPKVANAA